MANKPENLKPFAKGHDPRRNRKGRPKSFDALRKLAQQIAHEEVTDKKGETLTVIEVIMRQWAKDPKLQAKFIEYAFGKVPDAVELSGKDGGAIETKVTLEGWRKTAAERLQQAKERLNE